MSQAAQKLPHGWGWFAAVVLIGQAVVGGPATSPGGSRHQRLEVIDELIAAGMPADAVDEVRGRQAMRVTPDNGRTAAVRRLLDHGAEPIT